MGAAERRQERFEENRAIRADLKAQREQAQGQDGGQAGQGSNNQ